MFFCRLERSLHYGFGCAERVRVMLVGKLLKLQTMKTK